VILVLLPAFQLEEMEVKGGLMEIKTIELLKFLKKMLSPVQEQMFGV